MPKTYAGEQTFSNALTGRPDTFSDRFSGYGSPGSVSGTMSNESQIKLESGLDRVRRDYNRSLIDSAFPAEGNTQPSHMGSQSVSPTKDYQ